MRRRLTKYETGIKHFFGKRYIWLLNSEGNLGLHKIDDKGDQVQLRELAAKQAEQAPKLSDLTAESLLAEMKKTDEQ